MANLPPPSWNNSLSSPLPAATPGQLGMAIAMKSVYNASYQLPSRSSNFAGTFNAYQNQYTPFNGGFIPNIPYPPSGFHQNLHGGQAYPANCGYRVTGMMNYPRSPITNHETTMKKEKHNQRHNFQNKVAINQTCNKPHSLVVAPRQTFSCDACEKDFSSKVTFHSHLEAHVECEHEGCSFQATRRVLKMHRAQAHSSKSCNIKLETPEDIAKWKEERKRNYPTVNNILKKKEEEENRKAAGNILNTTSYRYKSNFEKQQSQKRGQRNRRNSHRNRNLWKRNQKHLPREIQNQEISSSSTFKQATEDDLAEDSNQGSIRNAPKLLDKTCNKKATSAMNLLAASYGDISSEDENSEDENNRPALEIRESSSRILDGETEPASKRTKSALMSTENSVKRGKRKRKEPVPVNNCNKKPTLLEMLLAPEVRHERNVILQCIRHIVKHNFFDNVK